MKQWTVREAFRQSAEECCTELPLGFTQRGRIPFRLITMIDGDEGRFAPHREGTWANCQFPIDILPQLLDVAPLLIRVGFRHTWVFVNPCDRHLKAKLDFTLIDPTRDG